MAFSCLIIRVVLFSFKRPSEHAVFPSLYVDINLLPEDTLEEIFQIAEGSVSLILKFVKCFMVMEIIISGLVGEMEWVLGILFPEKLLY